MGNSDIRYLTSFGHPTPLHTTALISTQVETYHICQGPLKMSGGNLLFSDMSQMQIVFTCVEIEREWPSRWRWSPGRRLRGFCWRWKIHKLRSQSFVLVEEARPEKRFQEMLGGIFASLLCSSWEGISSSTSFLVILSAVWLNLAENKKMWQLDNFFYVKSSSQSKT